MLNENEASLNDHNFSFICLITLILGFSESLEKNLSDGVLKLKVYFGPVFDKIPWAMYGLLLKMRNYDQFQI